MELSTIRSYKSLRIIGILILLSSPPFVFAYICSTISQLFSSCSVFINYGTPDPSPGSRCCDAMSGLSIIANSGGGNKQSVCRCVMSLIQNYIQNATAIGTLPGLCGISLGFTIIPNSNCLVYD